MGFFSVEHIKLSGISAAVPKKTASNFDLKGFEKDDLSKLIDTVGIESRRVVPPEICASDLCVAAAEKLIKDLKWDKSEIEVIFFVTQTPDYQLPGTSMHIQERLGIPKSCVSFDISQGCAGYVYGLSLIAAFLSSTKLKKGLLLVGDTITKLISEDDKSLVPLFSDCGTATALCYDSFAKKIDFNISSEGNDYEAIIVPEGGARHPFSKAYLQKEDLLNTNSYKGLHLNMKGLDVFNFSLKKVAPNVEELLSKSAQEITNFDYFIFHQANKLIIEALRKKLNISPLKVPSSLKNYGNTSGATIPLTIVTNLNKNGLIENSTMLLSGFGVGLSLASAIVHFENVVCSDIIEI